MTKRSYELIKEIKETKMNSGKNANKLAAQTNITDQTN